jgi:hypothetical protein
MRQRFLRDVGVGLMGFVLILAVSYTLGRAIVPAFPQALGDLEVLPTTVAEEIGADGSLTVEQMRADVAGDDFPAMAFLQSSGALEGRFHLNLTDYREWQDEGVAEGPVLDLDMKYYSGFNTDDPTLTITARDLGVGTQRTEHYTVLVSWEAKTFLAKPGQCTIDLLDLRFTLLPPRFGGRADLGDRTMPVFLAQAACTDVKELRTDEAITFTVVFDYDPGQFTAFG